MFLSLPMAAFSWHSLILEAEEERESERKGFCGTLVARFIDVFAPWMWQVLLGYLWTTELFSIPASGDKFGGEKTHTHTSRSVKVAEMLQELYECSLSCQGTVCSRSLTAGTKWWRTCEWHCCRLKITCWTCGQTLKTDLDHFCTLSHILNLSNCECSSMNSYFGSEFWTKGHTLIQVKTS